MRRNRLYIILILIAVALYWYLQQGAKAPVEPSRPGQEEQIGELRFSRHARCRMDCRHIDESEVREILQKGTINYAKSEPEARPDPKYAYEGRTHDGQQVRIIIAKAPAKWVVVTVIDLKQEWQCACE